MKKGFTLIELLVVVLIIGILSAIALPQYTAAVEKSRLTEAISNINTMKKQIELYVLENGFPTGNNAVPYSNMSTSVDLSGGQWDQYGTFRTKYFGYYSQIVYSGAGIQVFRNSNDSSYQLIHDFNGTQWTQECYTYENTIGRKICKSLEPLGYEYIDSDY